jgi:hypothetical protein
MSDQTPALTPRVLISAGAVMCFVGLFLSAIIVAKFTDLGSLGLWFSSGLTLFAAGIALLAVGLWSLPSSTSIDFSGMAVTFGALVLLVLVTAWASEVDSLVLLTVSAGAMGGVIHEIAQSNGTIVFPGPRPPGSPATGSGAPPAAATGAPPAAATGAGSGASSGTSSSDGSELYLGSLAGLFLGGVAGLLIFQSAGSGGIALGVTAFFAGLALKGVSEAISTSATHQG